MCDVCSEITPEERAALPPLTRIRHGLTPYPEPPRGTDPDPEEEP